jgi:hypothetical protein
MEAQTLAAILSLVAAGACAIYALIALRSKIWSACGTTLAMSAMLSLLSYGMYAGIYTPVDERDLPERGYVLSSLASYTTARPVQFQAN